MGLKVLRAAGLCVALATSLALSAAPVKLRGLPAADFDKLPPDAQLDVDGRMLTKAQLLSELETKKQQAAQKMPRFDFASARAKLLADEKAEVEAANGSLRAGWGSIAADAAAAKAAGQGGPRIERIVGQPIRDTGVIGIRGSGFGTEPGEVRLVGPFPGGHIKLWTCSGGFAGSAPIVYCDWKPHAIYTTDSFGSSSSGPSISGIPDQQLQILVVTKKGERSAPFPVAFRARRVLQELTSKDVSVERSNPLEGACVPSQYPEIGAVTITCAEGYDTSPSWHFGVDRVSAKLRNGWTFDSRSSVIVYTQVPPTKTKNPLGYEIGQLSYEGDRTTAHATCTYFSVGLFRICAIDLWAVGPEGVPWK